VVDPEARHAHKTVTRRQDGFKAHLVVEPDTGLITACEVTKAGPDAADGRVGVALLSVDASIESPVDVFADSAYGTGHVLTELAETGHAPLVKPWPTRPVVPGGFTLDDFAVDKTARAVTCPNGITRPISRTRRVTFGAACRGCPFLARCTTSARGRKLTLHEHDALQRARGQRAKDPDWQAPYRRHRPMVQRSRLARRRRQP